MLMGSIEPRHAPLALWIHDPVLAQDPVLHSADPDGRNDVLHSEDVADHRDRPDAAEDHDPYAGHLYGVSFLWFPSGLVLYYIVITRSPSFSSS